VTCCRGEVTGHSTSRGGQTPEAKGLSLSMPLCVCPRHVDDCRW
jgi:hypothetical protein